VSAFACVVVPCFLAAAVERVEPALRERPLIVVTGTAPATRVVDVSAAARVLGVYPSMTEAEARARCPELTSRACADEVRAAARHALLDAALAVSPRVEDAGPGVVHVDTSGLDRLIGDATAVGRRLVREARAVGFTATVGLAESRAAARVAARLGRAITVVEAGREREALAGASLTLLEPDAATAATLARWGVRTLGELAALPRDGLAARLGPRGLRLHDLARGLDHEPFQPYTPPPFYQEAQGVDWEIETLDALAAVLGPVLERLAARLTAGHLAADVLDVALRLVSGEQHHRRVALAHPLADPRAMLTLVRLDLEAHPPAAAVVAVAITAHPVRVVPGQGGLWQPSLPAIRELAAVLTRLASLVGPSAVGTPVVVDSHRPDPVAVARFEPGAVVGSAGAGGRGPGAPRGADGLKSDCEAAARPRVLHAPLAPRDAPGPRPPAPAEPTTAPQQTLALRRLRPPRAIDVEWGGESPLAVRWNGTRYRVMTAAGPWRLSGDWWDVDGWARDEWDVALADGTLCRIALDLRSGAWSLDGVYD
jgi:protein ImuB